MINSPRTVKERVTFKTDEGIKSKELTRVSDDEKDRLLIRSGVSRAAKASSYVHALSRVGDIKDVNFPLVSRIRVDDGPGVDGLDEDDAHMSGERPKWLNEATSTTKGELGWMLSKTRLLRDLPKRTYDPDDFAAHERLQPLVGAIDSLEDKYREATRLLLDQKRSLNNITDAATDVFNRYEEMIAKRNPGYEKEVLYNDGELEELDAGTLDELKNLLKNY